MRKRVLILGPKFYNYNKYIKRAFKSLNYEVMEISYLENISGIVDIVKYHYLPKISVNIFTKKKRNKLNNLIKEKYDEFNPDIVFAIKGSEIDKETLMHMKKTKKILWMMDSIHNIADIENSIECYNYIFAFENSDVTYLEKKGISAYFMPIAADDETYYPKETISKVIDIIFVGALYDGRKEFLERVVKDFKEYNIKIYGKYLSLRDFRTYHKYYKQGLRKYFTNKNIDPNLVNDLYNNSKIAINIHHNQSKYGCNPRFFEILSTKTFQIVDENQFVQDRFVEEKEIVTYKNYEDLKQKLKFYLSHEKERIEIANEGYQKVRGVHTFKNRVNEIIEIIDN